MEDNKLIEMESNQQVVMIAKYKIIRQCVCYICITAITIFACVYFDNPKFLWLLLLFAFAS